MQLSFNSIAETTPGPKWKLLFDTHWAAYRAWLLAKGTLGDPDMKTCRAQLKKHMPEMLPVYKQFCDLAGNDPVAARFLTGYQPPAYISGCAQAVFKKDPQLVRNYDYDPYLSEGTLFNSAWNGKHVIAVGDCLWGAVDGMNSDGIVVSLTFGGRQVVGKGFGIPFILRYVLEFSSTLKEAVAALVRIPSHMAYNVMVMDKNGDHKLVQLAPDKKPQVSDLKVSTNHQGAIDWPSHAAFTRTVEREMYLYETLAKNEQTADCIAAEFLQKPLFNTQYSKGFGTVYTSVYRPREGYMELRWPDQVLHQSFADFTEGITVAHYSEGVAIKAPAQPVQVQNDTAYADASAQYWIDYGKSWTTGKQKAFAQMVEDSVPEKAGDGAKKPTKERKVTKPKKIASKPLSVQDVLDQIAKETEQNGHVPWQRVAALWGSLGG